MESKLAELAEDGSRKGGLVGLDVQASELSGYLSSLVEEARGGWKGAPENPSRRSSKKQKPGAEKRETVPRRPTEGPIRLVLVHGPPMSGKRSLSERAVRESGFEAHRPSHCAHAREVFDGVLDFCKSSAPGVDRMISGGAKVIGKAVMIFDCLSSSRKYSLTGLVDALRGAMARKLPPWPIVVVATCQVCPGKSSSVTRACDAVIEVSHPGPDDCFRHLTRMFSRRDGGVGEPLDEVRLRRACDSEAGGGVVASLTEYYSPRERSGEESRCPPLYSGFVDSVEWALRRSREPPEADTFAQVSSAISNEPALAALILREAPDPPPPRPTSGIERARSRLAYMSLSDGVEALRGFDGMSTEVAAASFEMMAVSTSAAPPLPFPRSFSMASARRQYIKSGKPGAQMDCCSSADSVFEGRHLDGALIGKRSRARSGRFPVHYNS